MAGIDRQGFASCGIHECLRGLLPEGVIVAIGGFGDGVTVYEGGVGPSTSSGGPLSHPPGEGTFPRNGLAICG